MNRRPALIAVVLLASVVAVVGVSRCGNDGPDKAQGRKLALADRKGAATAYWKAVDALPAGKFDTPSGVGMFRACQAGREKNGKGAARYDLADYLQPMRDDEKMAELLATVKTALAPQGWRFTSVPIADSLMPDPVREPLSVWQAEQDGRYLQLTLHEGKDGLPAAGYLDVLTGCRKYGKAQKEVIAHYGGSVRDEYRATSKATPDPIPTGFPTATP
jgi:hypothetical protein